MSVAKKLLFIGIGYAIAIASGLVVATANELLMPADISQNSSGMVAFGDMILFVLAAGSFGLIPTWFLLKLLAERFPGLLLTILLVIAVMGPVSWLIVTDMANPVAPGFATSQLVGLVIAFVAIPRIVAGPVVILIEGLSCFFVRPNGMKLVIAMTTMLDIVPLCLFAIHMARAARIPMRLVARALHRGNVMEDAPRRASLGV